MADTPLTPVDPMVYARQQLLAQAEDLYYESTMAAVEDWITRNAYTGMNVGELRDAVRKGVEAATDQMQERFAR